MSVNTSFAKRIGYLLFLGCIYAVATWAVVWGVGGMADLQYKVADLEGRVSILESAAPVVNQSAVGSPSTRVFVNSKPVTQMHETIEPLPLQDLPITIEGSWIGTYVIRANYSALDGVMLGNTLTFTLRACAHEYCKGDPRAATVLYSWTAVTKERSGSVDQQIGVGFNLRGATASLCAYLLGGECAGSVPAKRCHLLLEVSKRWPDDTNITQWEAKWFAQDGELDGDSK